MYSKNQIKLFQVIVKSINQSIDRSKVTVSVQSKFFKRAFFTPPDYLAENSLTKKNTYILIKILIYNRKYYLLQIVFINAI